MVPFFDLKRQYESLKEELNDALIRVAESTKYIGGHEVSKFEEEVGNYLGTNAVGVSSGTDALIVALMALDIGPGDEVITTPYTFFATVEAIIRVGATPVFVDIDPTYNINPSIIEDKLTRRTRAIIPVHLFGKSADMTWIMSIAKMYNLYVIEDCAQAFGTTYNNKFVGTIGDIGCFSFFPSKNLGTMGDGGLVTTHHKTVLKKIKMIRNHGSTFKYYHNLIGGNFRLDAIQATILRVKLPHIDKWIELRRKHAETYITTLWNFVDVPKHTDDHSYNQFVIKSKSRDQLKKYLESKGIGSAIYYPLPIHMQTCINTHDELPMSEECALETLALPIFPELKTSEVEEIIDEIRTHWSSGVHST